MQNALKLSIVSSQIIANDLNFRVPTIFPVPSIAISRLLILPTCVYCKHSLSPLSRNHAVTKFFVMFHMRIKSS